LRQELRQAGDLTAELSGGIASIRMACRKLMNEQQDAHKAGPAVFTRQVLRRED
jgi:hypothetical protein